MTTLMDNMTDVFMVYQRDKTKLHGYVILFGNKVHGKRYIKKHLSQAWGWAIRMSQSKHWGDVTLLYKGKCIRGLSNGNIHILDKKAKYKYKLTKYEYTI